MEYEVLPNNDPSVDMAGVRIDQRGYYGRLPPEMEGIEEYAVRLADLIRQREFKLGRGRSFTMPAINDRLEQIRIVCQASPKLRTLLAIVCNAVLYQRKQCIWVLISAEQLLLWDILRKLNIDARMYSSDLTFGERCRRIQLQREHR
jgi:hypothetical protein